MKATVYKCKKCSALCNGSGVSFELVPVETKKIMLLSMSSEMDHYPDHACGQEHMVQIFHEELARLKGSENIGVDEAVERR